MLFFKTPVVRIACLVFVVIFIANIFHFVSGDIFVGAVVAFLLVVGVYFVIWRSSTAATRTLEQSTRTATLAADLPAGHGAVYVSRYGTSFLPGPMITATLNSTSADLRNGTSARWLLPAGQHTLVAAIKGTNVVSQNIPAAATFTLTAGQTLYFLTDTTMDLKRYTVQLTPDPDSSRVAGTTFVTPC